MSLPPIQPYVDRGLSADERLRVHVALLEVEASVGAIPGDLSGWHRVFWVQASRCAPAGALDVHLVPPRRVAAKSEVVARRSWWRWWR